MLHTRKTFHLPGNPSQKMDYLLFLPKDYERWNDPLWPLILFLHGRGESGDDPTLVLRTGLPEHIERHPEFPFITVSPQCPDRSSWVIETEMVHLLLQDVISSLPVDPERIYLTGISMGGAGAWHLGSQYPELFAAVAPICGFGQTHLGYPKRACALKNTPVWTFHGARDTVVPLEASRDLVDALEQCGGDVKFTVYPDAGHDSWTRTYENPDLYGWFLEHSLGRTRIQA